MKGTDKGLIGIVAGAIVLVIVALAVALLRPEPTYQPEDTPEGVVHNYLFALQQEDFARAYGYLSPTLDGYPRSAQAFEADVRGYSWPFRLTETSTALEVLSSEIEGNRATVTVQETRFYQGGLFGTSEQVSTFEVHLRFETSTESWKITDADYYWTWCWNRNTGCR